MSHLTSQVRPFVYSHLQTVDNRYLSPLSITAVRTNTSVEDDEEAELKALQASMAM